jgi:hypothetical protein
MLCRNQAVNEQGLRTKIIENPEHDERKRLSIRMAANEETAALSWSFFIIRIGFV